MADGPAADSPYQKQKEEVAAKPRQEAVVKGITPSTPAPVSAPRPARGQSKDAKPSFLSRLFALFMGSPKTEDKPTSRTSDRGNGRQNRRGGSNGRGANRNEGRQGRDRNQDRNQDRAESDQSRQERGKRGRGNGRGEKAEGQDARQDGSQAQAQVNGQNNAQAGQRGRRGAKPTDPSLSPDAELNVAAAVATEAAGPVDGQASAEGNEGEGTGRRRRRRRGSRGRGQAEDGQQASMDLAGDTEGSVSAPVAATATSSDPIVVPAEQQTAVPADQAVATTEAAAITPVAMAPVAATAVAPAAAPVDPAQLNQVLDAAGLQWVQTDPTKAPAEAVAKPPPQLGRKPRRNQASAESEPMVMVETRSSEQPPAS